MILLNKQRVCGVPSSLSCPACREMLVTLLVPSGHPLLALAPTGHKVAGDSLHSRPQIKLNWGRFYCQMFFIKKAFVVLTHFFTSMPRGGLFYMGSVLVLGLCPIQGLLRGSLARASWG